MSRFVGVGAREVARGWRWGARPPLPASAEPYQPPVQPREFPTAWARTGGARAVRVLALEYGMAPVMRSALRPVVHGLDNLAGLEDTPVLFVANHSSHLDTPMILCGLPPELRSRTAVTAAADYFFDSWWRGLSTAFMFGTVPIERRGGAPSSTPVDLLTEGWNLVIFPEGTRSSTGRMGRFRYGAAHLSITCGVPVVPVGIRGAFAAMPRGRSWPVPGRPAVSLRFGRPMWPAPAPPVVAVDADGRPAQGGKDVRAFTARIATEVSRLLAEDETTWWESLRAAPAAAPAPSRAAAPARWRQVWEATEPVAPSRPRSPWRQDSKK